ncbi:spectrin beta chain, non-erythrocytic 4-like [Malurus melanocephalus]|uniref:spectrin beta chain, non-erythrocytic 4-like n=1 Tax=Malurus melanocephalus TaxID=175006 RepID=UPI002548B87F|nr:spectrin beta chain, non-erythrocytic 4-like [Malurus melanocephalus]
MDEAESWIREKEQILAVKPSGHSLSSVTALTAKHRAMLAEMGQRRALLHRSVRAGEEIAAGRSAGAAKAREKLSEVLVSWKKLEEVTGRHQKGLEEAVSFFQFVAEVDELAAWLQDVYRVVSSDDFGHDEHSSRALLRKHRTVTSELDNHRETVAGLRGQLAKLAPAGRREGVEAQIRVVEVEEMMAEVAEVAVLRTQWLKDALDVYRMFGEVDACEAWMDEKEQWLETVRVAGEVDGVEVVQHRWVGVTTAMSDHSMSTHG